MAVDTRNKRASLMSAGRPWMPRLPLPDGGFTTAGDRAQLAWRYRGILDGAVPAAGGAQAAGYYYTPIARRRPRRPQQGTR